MLGKLAWEAFSFTYGFGWMTLLTTIAAVRDKALFSKPTKEEKKHLEIAQKRYWDLSTSPIRGFRHAFQTLKNGTKLHYVVNDTKPAASKNVAIFIHGFADSFVLWQYILESPELADYTLIAVDLPGYGGSDSLPSYGPDQMLETITAFIIAMREQYLQEEGKVVLVAHDWGGIIGTRLAAEARELADRFIVAGAVIPAHLRSRAVSILATSGLMLRTFLRNPFNTRLLKTAYTNLRPILGQLRRSFYIFVFTLPTIFAHPYLRMGNYWAVRNLHKIEFGVKISQKLTPQQSGEAMAISGGPGPEQFDTHVEGNGLTYSDSVQNRYNKDFGFSEKIRLYREKLGSAPWEKSIDTIVALSEIPVTTSGSSGGASLFEDGTTSAGSLKIPTTFLHGKYDLAFEPGLCLDGIGDYLPRGSQYVVLDKTGHWSPREVFGRSVLTGAVAWALGGEKENFKDRFGKEEKLQFIVDK